MERSRSGMLGRTTWPMLGLINAGAVQELTTPNEQSLFHELQTSKRIVQEQVPPCVADVYCHKLPTCLAPCAAEIAVNATLATLLVVISPACVLSQQRQSACTAHTASVTVSASATAGCNISCHGMP